MTDTTKWSSRARRIGLKRGVPLLLIGIMLSGCERLDPALSQGDPDYPKASTQAKHLILVTVFSSSSLSPKVDVRYRVTSSNLTCGDLEFDAGFVPIFLDFPIALTRTEQNDSWEGRVFEDALRPGRCGWRVESARAFIAGGFGTGVNYDGTDFVSERTGGGGQDGELSSSAARQLLFARRCPGSRECLIDNRGYGEESPSISAYRVPIKSGDTHVFIRLYGMK